MAQSHSSGDEFTLGAARGMATWFPLCEETHTEQHHALEDAIAIHGKFTV